MNKKTLSIYIILFASFFVLPFDLLAKGKDTTRKKDASSQKSYVVGVPARTLGEKYMTYFYDAVRSFDAAHDDVEFRILDAQLDAKRQLDLSNNMILDGVDALLLVPVTREIVLPIGKAARVAKVPLVVANNLGNEEGMKYADSYIGSREEDAGRIQAEYVGEMLGKETNVKLAVLMGPMGHAAQTGRTEGLSKVLERDFPSIEIVARQTANWDRSEAMAVTQDFFQVHPDLRVIVANNDEMAIGALLAARKAGISDAELLIGGVDATPDALEYLGVGLDFTVFQDAPAQGRESAMAAYQLAKGETVASRVWIPFELVTPENGSAE